MVAKKISRMWCVVIVFCLWGMSIASTVVIHQEQESVQLSGDATEEEEKEIVVTGEVSCGTNAVTGRACVVMNRSQLNKVRKGDIVIAPAINSLWYSTLNMAAGIITDKGDGSSLAISLGKKLNIPVIVGASGATKKIIDGQIITCDPITRNVYHVSYPNPKDGHFDVLIMPQKDDTHVGLHGKLEKVSNVRPPHEKPTCAAINCVIQHSSDNIPFPAAQKESKIARMAKDIYYADLSLFKKYVFKMRFRLNGVRALPFSDWVLEKGAKHEGCDDFAIACIPLSFFLFDHTEGYITTALQFLGDHVQDVDCILEECSKKPGDLNWVARVCHRAHIEAISYLLPSEIKKEELIADPKKYVEIDKKISKENREVFKRKQVIETLKSLYVRFREEEKKK